MEYFSSWMLMNSDLLALSSPSTPEDPASTDSPAGPTDIVPSERLSGYLALQGSTTFFLQTVAGRPVEVEVLHQSVETHPDKGDVLHRRSRLYVRHARNIILLAESVIVLSSLDAEQQRKLIERTEGIGRLLDPGNLGLLRKLDIEVLPITAPRSLETSSRWAISRHFALQFNGAGCGEIREILNNESLERAR